MDPEAERLLREADAHPFRGWDFSVLEGRVTEESPSWRYEDLVRDRCSYPLLDLGTGGGEFLSTLAPFDGLAVATEGWAPNVDVAAGNLRTVGAHVVRYEGAPDNVDWAGVGGELPFRDESFAMVIDRHEAFSPTEVHRVLGEGGREPPGFPGFTIEGSRDLLPRINETIQSSGGLIVHEHRYFLEARRPS